MRSLIEVHRNDKQRNMSVQQTTQHALRSFLYSYSLLAQYRAAITHAIRG